MNPISPFFTPLDLNSSASPSGLQLNPCRETLKLPLQLSLRLVASLITVFWLFVKFVFAFGNLYSIWHFVKSRSLFFLCCEDGNALRYTHLKADRQAQVNGKTWEELRACHSQFRTARSIESQASGFEESWFVLQFVEVVLAAVSNCGLSIRYAAPHLHRVTWLADSEGTQKGTKMYKSHQQNLIFLPFLRLLLLDGRTLKLAPSR